jgi:hypothetical protein
MDEIVKQVATRAGISEDQARTAVSTVLGFLKDRLPTPIGGQLDSLTGQGAAAAGDAGDIASDLASKVGNIFGK